MSAVPRPDTRTAGVALLAGYALLVGVLFAAGPGGLSTATAGVRNAVSFLVVPALGFASGVYAVLDGPGSAVAVFVTASYLGLAGVTLALVLTGSPTVVTLVGVGLFALAVVALVGSLADTVGALGL